MGEHRKLERRHIMFYSRVFNRKTGRLLGHLENITPEGAMIISEEPLRTDYAYSLSISLPGDIYPKQALNFEAQSIWCKPDIDPNFYNTGLQLLDLSEEDIAIVEQIIEDYGFRN
ncbi:MAG: PilZ domain-containing protein [Chloroflexota bacterium]|nr:PilZ domain-containing protein [Chloroflexota bacterium]